MAYAWRRPDTAFSNAPASGKKRPREHDKAHCEWLRTLPCVISGARPVDVAHIRYADPSYGKRATGMAEKPDDAWTVPLSRALHMEQHEGNERLFWAKYGLDPLKIAAALKHNTQDDEQAFVILREAWRTVAAMRSSASEKG